MPSVCPTSKVICYKLTAFVDTEKSGACFAAIVHWMSCSTQPSSEDNEFFTFSTCENRSVEQWMAYEPDTFAFYASPALATATSSTVFTTETSFCSDIFVTTPFTTIVVAGTPFTNTFRWRTGFSIVQVECAKESDEITCVMSLPSGTTG